MGISHTSSIASRPAVEERKEHTAKMSAGFEAMVFGVKTIAEPNLLGLSLQLETVVDLYAAATAAKPTRENAVRILNNSVCFEDQDLK